MDRYDQEAPAVSYALLDASGAMIGERRPDEPYYAASTIKLGVMLGVALATDAGLLVAEEEVELPELFPSGIAGARPFSLAPDDRDPGYRPGDSATVAGLVEQMIERSSNEATNILVGRIGLDSVNDALQRCGATATRMERAIGDLEAADAGRTNVTNAGDLVRVMRSIVSGAHTSAATTARMRRTLMRQQHARIGAELPAGIVWGSKSGNVPGIVHDVAFVGDPETDDVRCLAVCTRGFGDEQGRAVIAALTSALLVDARGRGGGAWAA